MEQINERIYFLPGDVVTIKQDIPNRPIMIVIRKESLIFKHDINKMKDNKPTLLGMRCRWFTNNGEVQESIFSTKDLIKLN